MEYMESDMNPFGVQSPRQFFPPRTPAWRGYQENNHNGYENIEHIVENQRPLLSAPSRRRLPKISRRSCEVNNIYTIGPTVCNINHI